MESLGEFRAQEGADIFPTLSTLYLVCSMLPTPEPSWLGAECAQGRQRRRHEAPPQAYAPEAPVASNSCFS